MAVLSGEAGVRLPEKQPEIGPEVWNVAGEAVAGFFWMHLNVARDVGRAELENYAARIVDMIRHGASRGQVEAYIRAMQERRVLRSASQDAISQLMDRAIRAVNGVHMDGGRRPAPRGHRAA